MYFTPKYNTEIIKSENFNSEIEKINKILEPIAVSGYFNSHDNKSLFYEYFLCENAKATVVMVHGLSEFTKKYYEYIYYCLNEGFNVFIYDQRGHGLSFREAEDITLLHVDNYKQYVKDLDKFINSVVLGITQKPIYLYSHSMGGAVAAMYLASKGQKAEKAVLSAPLFRPVMHYSVPNWFARSGLFFARIFVGGKWRFPGSKDFNPEVKFNAKHDQCVNRFEYNLEMRKNNPYYQTTPLSLGWTYSTLGLKAKVLSNGFIKKIKTPVLLITAKDDTVVENGPQFDFAKKCGCCKQLVIENAKHGMLTGEHKIMSEHISAVMEFFNS